MSNQLIFTQPVQLNLGISDLSGGSNATWNSIATTVQSNSATWNSSLGDIGVNTIVHATSANWNSAYTTVNTSSASWTGAVGGGTDRGFYENDSVLTTSYSITSGKNAGSFGPITISNGVIITVPNGSAWTIA